MKPFQRLLKTHLWAISILLLNHPAGAEGFLGHEISMYGKYYNHDNVQTSGPQFLIDTAVVGPGLEFPAICVPGGGCSPDIDLDAFSIEFDQNVFKQIVTPGNFNGLVFEDTNDSLPDFVSVTIDRAVSVGPSPRILVSPNSIWVNEESLMYCEGDFLRLKVTFADRSSTSDLTLSRSLTEDMILEAPTTVGAQYRFEQSEDLITFTPIHEQFTAIAPFRTLFIKPTAAKMFYRLRRLAAPATP